MTKYIKARDGEKILVDGSMYGELKKISWFIPKGEETPTPRAYGYFNGKYRKVKLNKFIYCSMNEKDYFKEPNLKIYHKDGDPSNCTVGNLDIKRNTSKYVYRDDFDKIITPRGYEVIVDKGVIEKIKNRSVYIYKERYPIVTQYEGRRNVSLVSIILDFSIKKGGGAIYKNGNSLDLRERNLSLVNHEIIERERHIEVHKVGFPPVKLDKEFRYLVEKNNIQMSGERDRLYPVIDRDKERESIHRIIVGAKEGDIVDHINHNTLDNRRGNLRKVTNSENSLNKKGPQINSSSGYRGVHKTGREGKWRAVVGIDGDVHRLGTFNSPEEANEVVKEFRRKNVPVSEKDKIKINKNQ